MLPLTMCINCGFPKIINISIEMMELCHQIIMIMIDIVVIIMTMTKKFRNTRYLIF